MNEYMLPPSMYQILTVHGRCCMQNNQLLTISHVELENYYNALLIFNIETNCFQIIFHNNCLASLFWMSSCLKKCRRMEYDLHLPYIPHWLQCLPSVVTLGEVLR